MKISRNTLTTGVAVVVALGVGFAVARLPFGQPQPSAAESHEEEKEGPEGFVALPESAAAEAGVTVIPVEAGAGAETKLPGRVAFAPGAEAVVDSPVAGTVLRVHVGVGDRVAAGQALVTVRSPDGAASRAEVDAAEAAAEAARAAERRDRTLFEQGWIAQARLDVTAAEARRAEAELRSARARAQAYGAPGSDGVTVVRSPIAGVVTRVAAAPGQTLHEEALQVATVADPRRVELVFEAPPAIAASIRVGDAIRAGVAQDAEISGVVIAVSPAESGGAAVVRARPSGGALAPGAVLSARLTTGQTGQGGWSVPMDAVQTVEGRTVVFVVENEGFRARAVTTGRTASGRIEILSGLDGSERIAGAGAFLLKAELAKGEAEHGH